MRQRAFAAVIILALASASAVVIEAITNGRPDGNAHPYVGLLVFDDAPGEPAWSCSGTLISPTVVLTAGHCTEGAVAARIWFASTLVGNPDYPGGGPSAIEGTANTYPDFCIGCDPGLMGFDAWDIGIVVLDTPVTGITPAQLPEAGVTETLAMGTAIDVVGYGVQAKQVGGGPPQWTWNGQRYYAPTQLVASEQKNAELFIKLTANPGRGKGGICFGDSGGPDLLGGTATILAVNSFVTNGNCSGVTYSQRVDLDPVLEWIGTFLQ